MLYTAFIFGLISSLHCIGMCGPIAMMLPVDRSNQTKKTLQIFTYHLGRLAAYASIGFIFGLFGNLMIGLCYIFKHWCLILLIVFFEFF